jgi:hypothetical protein
MELNVKVLEKTDNLKNNLNIKNLKDNKCKNIKKNLNISEKDIGELSEKITGFENLTDKINVIKSFNNEKLRSSKIIEAESEIKNLCNSGFIIKNNNDFLIKTYGIIDEKTLASIKNMTHSTSVSENPIVEIQGIKFHEMTKYGRDIAVKNILISQDKFKEISAKKNIGSYSLNNEFKLSDFTLKNYFELKEKGLNINIKKTAPGTITADNCNNSDNFNYVKNNNIDWLQLPDASFYSITNTLKPDVHSHEISNTIKYELLEKPSVYIWKNKSGNIENIISKTLPESSKPLLGALNYYKNYLDGFKNIKISIDNKKIMELESHFNWDKVREYIKKRDYEYAKSIYSQVNISGNQHLNSSLDININKKQTPVQIHHINQLQDGGADNITNYVALSEAHHKQIDSCDIFIDKNLSHYKEFNFEKNIESNNAGFKQNITNENEMRNLLNTIGELSTSEKILLNEIKTTVESNSSCRLTMAISNESALKLKFTDYKTDEDLRIYSLKNFSERERLIAFAGLNNFIKELTTYNKII